jgi:hypothetical protein
MVEQNADGGHVLREGGGGQAVGLGGVQIVTDVEGGRCPARALCHREQLQCS